jgi:hypothetical protein
MIQEVGVFRPLEMLAASVREMVIWDERGTLTTTWDELNTNKTTINQILGEFL